jgi:hypothetical protein
MVLEMLDWNDGELMDGIGVFTVKREDVETDRKSERGQ